MRNWETLDADVNQLMNKHYTAGRGGRRIDKIILHHNAGNLSISQCWNVWQTREASAHYQVQADGTIGQLVWDKDTAWHAGNWDANCSSIGIEHADISTSPWAISEATLDNGAHLVAALCKYYKLGAPEWGKNVFGHSDFYATSCPASIGGSQKAAYMARAKQWYNKMVGGTAMPSKPVTQASKPNVEDLARRTIAGEFGNGAERQRRLGANYTAVMNRVNQILGVAEPAKKAQPNIDELVRRTLAGEFGNGDARKAALGSNYVAVQAKINQIYGVGAPQVDLNDLATRTIAGEFGNGEERKRRLGANYAAVMAIVNKRLGY